MNYKYENVIDLRLLRKANSHSLNSVCVWKSSLLQPTFWGVFSEFQYENNYKCNGGSIQFQCKYLYGVARKRLELIN